MSPVTLESNQKTIVSSNISPKCIPRRFWLSVVRNKNSTLLSFEQFFRRLYSRKMHSLEFFSRQSLIVKEQITPQKYCIHCWGTENWDERLCVNKNCLQSAVSAYKFYQLLLTNKENFRLGKENGWKKSACKVKRVRSLLEHSCAIFSSFKVHFQ